MLHTPRIHRALGIALLRRAKWNRTLSGHAQERGTLKTAKSAGGNMKKITLAIAVMCALSAYVSYPSATMSGGAAPSLALLLQESRSLPVEAYDAV
jgi:hypothetical protein